MLLTSCGSVNVVPASSCGDKVTPMKAMSGSTALKWVSEDDTRTLYADLTSLFQSENPSITISQQDNQNHDALVHSLAADYVPGVSPDLFSIDVIWVPEIASKGYALPLCDYWSAKDRTQYFPLPMNAVTIDNKIYAAPFRTDLGLLYYRTDITSQPPKTWVEMENIAAQAQATNRTPYGYVWQGEYGEGLVCDFLEVLYSYGGTFDLHDLKTINSPEAIFALNKMIKWVNTVSLEVTSTNIRLPAVTIVDEDGSGDIWRLGYAAFMRNWPYEYVTSNKRGTGVAGRFSVAALPYNENEKDPKKRVGRSCLGGWCLAINAKAPSNQRDAAWEFIYWMMQAEAQQTAAKNNGWLMTLQSIYDEDNHKDLVDAYAYFGQNIIPNILQDAIQRPSSPHYTEVSTKIIQKYLHQALTGELKAAELALQKMQDELQHFPNL